MTVRHKISARRRTTAVGGVMLAATLMCVGLLATSASAAHSAAARGGTLTLGSFFSNGSIDPAAANVATDNNFLDPIYAPLLQIGTNGQIKGVLATSWKYIGSNNKTFELTLRKGVVFSNGQPVNAAAVAASLKHVGKGTGGASTWLSHCLGIKAVSTYVVELKCAQPDPDLALQMTGDLVAGDIVAPASLAHPSTLDTDPIGAGEYTLDTSATTIGSTYTYVANPKYFDQSAIHWNKIVVETITNPGTGLAAVQSGQIQEFFDPVDPSLQAAASANVAVDAGQATFQGVELADRTPSASNPLGKLAVRQALAYAVDRPAIVSALFGQFGSSTDQVAIPTQPSAWDAGINNYYSYDPTKAKSLLASAGYPNGFTINVEDQGSTSAVTQAVLGYWNAIGVTAHVTLDTTTAGWIQNADSKNFPALGYIYGGLPMFLEATNWFEPAANQFNPWASTSPALGKLVKKAESAPPAKQNADWHAVQDYGVKQAWYVGVAVGDAGYLHTNNVNVAKAHGLYLINILDTTPAS
jgi:peptide/nickel transport system substrate-binding protein